ncbi:hypothetical protein BCF33_0800 [Hasllibacter halocynthiae]|uniref:ATPase n=1 Tax=Hasllibacter halocynthiae TaxID=595589 RepID=A0A2T0X8C3_9RHOB|nr:ATPase [Hasllibacter halocynthiae]PRY95186.1 hypothetical protein BCF33_0800 [Hasllibacter halocynthiae]
MERLYPSGAAWLGAPRKRLLIYGMSGLGKTRLAAMLRGGGTWFHYSVDYRIGTRYLGEAIADGFKAEAMKVPALARLLRTDSIYVASNLTFDNLAPMSDWLGKPGDPGRGGLPFDEYERRQALHRAGEVAALEDAEAFAARAGTLYGYPHFVCDTSGSICEVVEPEDPDDPLLRRLAATHQILWIEDTDAHADALKARFDAAPKPMYYRPEVLRPIWAEAGGEGADPDAFVRHAYAEAIRHRRPRYRAMARWGATVTAEEVAACSDAAAIDAMVARAIDRSLEEGTGSV